MGAYESDLQAAGVKYDTYTKQLKDNDRSVCEGDTAGFVRVITKEVSDLSSSSFLLLFFFFFFSYVFYFVFSSVLLFVYILQGIDRVPTLFLLLSLEY